MIDFISTHPNADSQTIACARLLAAVIAQAVEDASNKDGRSGDASSATAWIFEEGSAFEQYANLIGANPKALRAALIAPSEPGQFTPKNSRFDESKRRTLRLNHIQWLKRKELARQMADKQ